MSRFHGSMNEYLAVVKGSSDDISLTEHFKGKLIGTKVALNQFLLINTSFNCAYLHKYSIQWAKFPQETQYKKTRHFFWKTDFKIEIYTKNY